MKMGSRFPFYDFQMFSVLHILHNKFWIRKSIVITIVLNNKAFEYIGLRFSFIRFNCFKTVSTEVTHKIRFKPKFTELKKKIEIDGKNVFQLHFGGSNIEMRQT